jgi:RNase adaptor protein for sRNA GlmZ degradation
MEQFSITRNETTRTQARRLGPVHIDLSTVVHLSLADANLHRCILRENHFLSSGDEVRVQRYSRTVRAHPVTESARLHRQSEHHSDQPESVRTASNSGSRPASRLGNTVINVSSRGGGGQS